MYNDKYGEKFPDSKFEKEQRGEYADLWDDADMEGTAPEFTGDDPYNPKPEQGAVGYDEFGRPIDAEGNVIVADEKNQATDADRYETKRQTADRGFGGAEKLTSYGLDTAARIYGLEPVLKAVSETDESGRDVQNPIGSVYSRLVPNPDERKHLYHEIQRESIVSDVDDENVEGASRDKLGFDENTGDFYAKEDVETTNDEFAKRETNNAVKQMKKLLDALNNDARFASVRERAAEAGKDVVSYIVSGEVNPTISTFFDGLDAASGGSVEEILDEIEKEEASKQVEEYNDKVSSGEDITKEDQLEAIEAAEKLDNPTEEQLYGLNPEIFK